jgi:hypothetical protein
MIFTSEPALIAGTISRRIVLRFSRPRPRGVELDLAGHDVVDGDHQRGACVAKRGFDLDLELALPRGVPRTSPCP